jgi:hypothetical protein
MMDGTTFTFDPFFPESFRLKTAEAPKAKIVQYSLVRQKAHPELSPVVTWPLVILGVFLIAVYVQIFMRVFDKVCGKVNNFFTKKKVRNEFNETYRKES